MTEKKDPASGYLDQWVLPWENEVTQAQYETVMTGNSEGLNAKPSALVEQQ